MNNSDFDLTFKSEKDKLFSMFRKRTELVSYAHGALNSNLVLIAGKKPDWFEGLDSALNIVKGNAQTWLDDFSPKLVTLPQYYINFNNEFMGLYPMLISSLDTLISKSSFAEKEEAIKKINLIFGRLIEYAKINKNEIEKIEKDLSPFFKLLSENVESLKEKTTKVNENVSDEVTDLTSEIAALQEQLKQDITATEAAGITGGIAFIAAIIAIVIIFIEPGAAAIGGAIIAGLVAIGGGVVTAIFGAAIKEDQDKILEKQAELEDEEKEIVILNSIGMTIQALQNSSEENYIKLTDLKDTWKTLEENFKEVRDRISGAEEDPETLKEVKANLVSLKKGFG